MMKLYFLFNNFYVLNFHSFNVILKVIAFKIISYRDQAFYKLMYILYQFIFFYFYSYGQMQVLWK